MRQIKFRVWSGEKYYHLEATNKEANHYLQIGKDTFWLFDIEGNLVMPVSIEKCIIQQQTGFTDKNGKEIYEGDIISDWVNTDEGLVKSHKQVFWNNKRGVWCVDDTFIQDKTESIDLWLELHDFAYEISGNIYENPELLLNVYNDDDDYKR